MATSLVLAWMAAWIALASADKVLFCTHNEDERGECRRLRVIPPLDSDCDVAGAADDCIEFHCVIAEDCEEEVRAGRADVMAASALGMWYMEQDFGETTQAFAPIVAESRGLETLTTRQDGLTYKVLAIASSGTCENNVPLSLKTTKGLRSCHGAYGDLAGWVVPVAKLLSKGLALDEGDDIEIIQNFYEKSCAPSNVDGGSEVCSACSDKDYDDNCDLDDPYAGPLGVLRCLREDAADIGFLDHWTAWGAGQDGDDQSNAYLRNIGDFRVICNDGCRDLSEALEEACYLAKIPSDVLVMRASDNRISFVRTALLTAAGHKQFKQTFGTSSNLQGLLFSHGTETLVSVVDSAADYLGGLDGELTNFAARFKDVTDIAQPDADGNNVDRQVRKHPGVAIGVTFVCALLLGALIGSALIVFVFHYRNKSMRRQMGAEKPDYLAKDITGQPALAQIPEIGPAGIDRHGPLQQLDM